MDGRTHARTHTRTHGQLDNSIPTTNKVCVGGVIILSSIKFRKGFAKFMILIALFKHRRRKLFSIGGGGQTQRGQLQYLGGIAKSTYTHACTCTFMHTHALNIHTPIYACTRMYACMHSLCKHTFYILI